MRTQFQIEKALLVDRSLNDHVPGYLSSKFVKRYETRYSLSDSVNKLIVPFPRTSRRIVSVLAEQFSGACPVICLTIESSESLIFKYCVHGIHEKQVLLVRKLVVVCFLHIV